MAINCKELPTLTVTISLQIFTLHESFTICYSDCFFWYHGGCTLKDGDMNATIWSYTMENTLKGREEDIFRHKVEIYSLFADRAHQKQGMTGPEKSCWWSQRSTPRLSSFQEQDLTTWPPCTVPLHHSWRVQCYFSGLLLQSFFSLSSSQLFP